ncbi:MAG: signal recognition particle-docking protein FtsY [bacterium]
MKTIFGAFKNGLQKTKTKLVRNIQTTFSDVAVWNEETYEDLEAALISADIGVDASVRIVEDVRAQYERGQIHTTADILAVAEKDLEQQLKAEEEPPVRTAEAGPTVFLIVGVNGSGKTTTTAKLAHRYKNDGQQVVLAATDTFRAAGVEQLKIWGERVQCPVVAGHQGGDAAAVAYDAVIAAQRRNADLLLVDTAGRQHTSRELMEELAKVRRIIAKASPGAPHEVWLTVDASTGGNALLQAREFGRICELTGLILTKLDGTGKGGVVIPIRKELNLPIRYVGLGEQMDDLQPFDVEAFSRALFE